MALILIDTGTLGRSNEEAFMKLINGDTGTFHSTESFSDDPNFVSSEDRDFHLERSSPAIDNGTDVEVASDFEGNPRDTSLDIGAVEHTP